VAQPGQHRTAAYALMALEVVLGPGGLDGDGEVEFGDVGGLEETWASWRVLLGNDVNAAEAKGRVGGQDRGRVGGPYAAKREPRVGQVWRVDRDAEDQKEQDGHHDEMPRAQQRPTQH